MGWADTLVLGLLLYAGLGVGFAVGFVSYGMGVVDPATRGAGWGFRLLMIPGSAVLWPILWAKWWRTIVKQQHAAKQRSAKRGAGR